MGRIPEEYVYYSDGTLLFSAYFDQHTKEWAVTEKKFTDNNNLYFALIKSDGVDYLLSKPDADYPSSNGDGAKVDGSDIDAFVLPSKNIAKDLRGFLEMISTPPKEMS